MIITVVMISTDGGDSDILGFSDFNLDSSQLENENDGDDENENDENADISDG